MSKHGKRSGSTSELELDETTLLSATGSKTARAAIARLNEVINALFAYHRRLEKGDDDIDDLITDALASLDALAPRDQVESLLSTQMVATHASAMECLRRAALPEQSFEGRKSNLSHAHKLMSLYLRQVETLDKHRGKGRQKITVEHVNVEPGGQAIVGIVNANTPHEPSSVTHQKSETLPLIDADAEKETVGRSRKRRPTGNK